MVIWEIFIEMITSENGMNAKLAARRQPFSVDQKTSNAE